MTRTQALAKARKLLGPKALIQYDPRAPLADERIAQQARKRELHIAKREALEAMEARRKEVLLADAEYQRLATEHRQAADTYEKAPHGIRHRYDIGRNELIFFSVEASGDTLGEALAVLEKKKARPS